jgi:tetratricopeptide (TPR) repeat protein
MNLLVILAFVAHHGAAVSPPALEKGLGAIHYKVSTKNADAQRYFDQGLRYIYAFNHEQAIASFRRATELDPDLALGYWGIALALGPNINLDVDPEREKQAFDTVHEALRHLDGASPKERDLIRALARRYSDKPDADLKALAVDYSKAMGELHRKYPDDVDIGTLYAESLMDLRPWKFWSRDGKPAEGTEEIVRILEWAIAKRPDHTGANHYYIHAVEASKTPGRASKSAERLQTLAPAAGHLVHMPAHIFQRTGDYGAAARANEAGAKADRAFISKYGQDGIYPMMYYNHNLHFGAFSHAFAGRHADAMRLADEVGEAAASMAKQMAEVDPMAATPLLILVRNGKWAEVLRAKDPGAGPMSTALWHFARGVAFAQLGNANGAESEREAFEEGRGAFGDASMMFQSPPSRIAEIASHVLRGRIAAARGDLDAAIAAYRAGIAVEDQLNYNEPADWFYPVRESLGGTLLRAGRPKEAAEVFRQDLAINPKNPRSLFGLGETGDAAARNAFAEAWKNADVKLSVGDL